MSEAALAERATETWTCDRCEVTVQWMDGHEQKAKLPAHWSQRGDALHCLACRRDLAAESALDGLPEDTPLAERVQVQSNARIEFEVKRDPEKANGEIAKACRSSAAAVQKARDRLGLKVKA